MDKTLAIVIVRLGKYVNGRIIIRMLQTVCANPKLSTPLHATNVYMHPHQMLKR